MKIYISALRNKMPSPNSNKSLYSNCGFIYFILSAVAFALQFCWYVVNSGQHDFMDVYGWFYFVLAGIAHAALFAVIPFLCLFLVPSLMHLNRKVGLYLMFAGMVLLDIFFLVNGFVFSLYRFHINGLVINMLLAPDANQIFEFDTMLYLKSAGIVLSVVLFNFGLLWLSLYLAKKLNGVAVRKYSIITLTAALLLSQAMHIHAAAKQVRSVMESSSYIPYYFPLTMNKLLSKWGVIDEKKLVKLRFNDSADNLVNYPKHPIVYTKKNKPLNIVIIGIDSWNRRTLTQECMPNINMFAQHSERYLHHLSSSNGTRGGIFGLFFGVPSVYWKSFDYSSIQPALLIQMEKEGYQMQVYPSASLLNPPFAKTVFSSIKNLNTITKGNTSYERDCNITKNFIRDVEKYDGKRPFFSFLFYDDAHAIALPKEKLTHFRPSWDYFDYSKLNNTIDPTPVFNLYRNCLYEIDILVGRVLKTLKDKGLLNNTVIIITGDHGQEFNENHKNYWGHAGNYTDYQIGVPFVYYYPGCKPKFVRHRTTHYDVSATLMRQVLGVHNQISDFSMGYMLSDSNPRNWHIVGNDLNYAFIIDKDYIIEKKGIGDVDIFDNHLNPLYDYKLNAKDIRFALTKLNEFYRK